MSPDALIFAYVAGLLAALTLLTLYTEARRRRFRPSWMRTAFSDASNAATYTDDADVDRSRCAQCGTLNEPIRF